MTTVGQSGNSYSTIKAESCTGNVHGNRFATVQAANSALNLSGNSYVTLKLEDCTVDIKSNTYSQVDAEGSTMNLDNNSYSNVHSNGKGSTILMKNNCYSNIRGKCSTIDMNGNSYSNVNAESGNVIAENNSYLEIHGNNHNVRVKGTSYNTFLTKAMGNAAEYDVELKYPDMSSNSSININSSGIAVPRKIVTYPPSDQPVEVEGGNYTLGNFQFKITPENNGDCVIEIELGLGSTEYNVNQLDPSNVAISGTVKDIQQKLTFRCLSRPCQLIGIREEGKFVVKIGNA